MNGGRERRIECASCHKAPTDDPSIALSRVNVKGIPGVFLCQRCHLGEGREQAEIRRLTSERDQFEAERACSIHEGWKLVWCNECIRAQAAARAEDVRKIRVRMVRLEEALRWCMAKMDNGAGGLEYTGDANDVAFEKTLPPLLAEADGR